MKEMLQKGLFAGLGLLSVTREETEDILDKLVEKGKLNADEAETVAREFARRGKEKANSVEKSVADLMEAFMDRAPFVRKEEWESLKKRVEKLEKKSASKSAAQRGKRTIRKPRGKDGNSGR